MSSGMLNQSSVGSNDLPLRCAFCDLPIERTDDEGTCYLCGQSMHESCATPEWLHPAPGCCAHCGAPAVNQPLPVAMESTVGETWQPWETATSQAGQAEAGQAEPVQQMLAELVADRFDAGAMRRSRPGDRQIGAVESLARTAIRLLMETCFLPVRLGSATLAVAVSVLALTAAVALAMGLCWTAGLELDTDGSGTWPWLTTIFGMLCLAPITTVATWALISPLTVTLWEVVWAPLDSYAVWPCASQR